MKRRATIEAAAIFALALATFVPFLGTVPLFDWDEVNFAECAREMVVTGDYDRVTMNYAPFWEKPPLFFWLQAGAMRLFGVNEFSARLPNALCGAVSLVFLYGAGTRIAGRRTGWLWVAAYAGSLLPFLYFKSGIIDPVFNGWIYVSFYGLYVSGEKPRWAIWGGVAAGLAVLTKGPVGLLMPGLAVGALAVASGFRFPVPWIRLIVYFSTAAAVAAAWFAYELLKHGPTFIAEFVDYQLRLLSTEDAGHGGFFGYHVVVLLFGCMPASFFALPGLFRPAEKNAPGAEFYRWNLALFWVTLVVFSIVKTKILHYSSLCYFPLTFVAAWHLNRCAETGASALPKWRAWMLGASMGAVILAVVALPWLGANAELVIPYVKDPFAAENLKAQVDWLPTDAWPAALWALGAVWGLGLMRKGRIATGAAKLFGAGTAFMFFLLWDVVPKIERHTQGAAVDFFRSLQDQDVYLATLDYKSYAHYFYGRVSPPGFPPAHALLDGPSDKPAYFSAKIQHAPKYSDKLKKLYEKNGFVFFVRHPVAKDSLPALRDPSAAERQTFDKKFRAEGVPFFRPLRHKDYHLYRQNWHVQQDRTRYVFRNADGPWEFANKTDFMHYSAIDR